MSSHLPCPPPTHPSTYPLQVHKLLSGASGCVRRDGTRRVFLDVGANFGWYSVYAATMGCR
jgi:hypothetical protein